MRAFEIAKASSCDKQVNYSDLFELSTSKEYRGAANIQWLSEINEVVFINCPTGFLSHFANLPQESKSAVLLYFGITNPPWELGSVFKQVQHDQKFGKLINQYFQGFVDAKSP